MHIIIHHSRHTQLFDHASTEVLLSFNTIFFYNTLFTVRLNSCIIITFRKKDIYIYIIYILIAPIFIGGCYLSIKISTPLITNY